MVTANRAKAKSRALSFCPDRACPDLAVGVIIDQLLICSFSKIAGIDRMGRIYIGRVVNHFVTPIVVPNKLNKDQCLMRGMGLQFNRSSRAVIPRVP